MKRKRINVNEAVPHREQGVVVKQGVERRFPPGRWRPVKGGKKVCSKTKERNKEKLRIKEKRNMGGVG